MATHSSVLVWRIPGTAEPVSHNLKRIPEIREHNLPGKWFKASHKIRNTKVVDLNQSWRSLVIDWKKNSSLPGSESWPCPSWLYDLA